MTDTITIHGPQRAVTLVIKRRILSWILRGRSARRPQRFVVLPGDEVSNEIIVSGLYEEVLLAPLFEHFLRAKLADFAGGVAVDVGANIGNHTMFFARYFKRVLAVEPNPVTLNMLRCNAALSQAAHVEVCPCGLGEADGVFPFVQNETGNLGGSGFGFAGLSTGSAIECPVTRGDTLLTPDRLGGALRLMKFDIEGAELAALKGLRETLAREKPVILFESNVSGGDRGGNAVIALLRSYGYCHFAALEDAGHGRSRFARLLRLLVRGDAVTWREIETLRERRYPMIVASATPIR